jgi:PAS domain S-box-containing protein
MTEQSPSTTGMLDFFARGGEMGALMQTVDWAETPLGPVESWPQSLRTSISICLFSRFPIILWWGAEKVMVYNDAYRPMLGQKHPKSMGQRGRECWSEIWDIIGPMLEGVYYDGVATWSSDQMLPLFRNGYTEECYFTFSYSPIFDETGRIGGIFTAVTETTRRVLSERRLATLRDLSENANRGQSTEDACRMAAATLDDNPLDVPFAFIYLVEESSGTARLVAETTGTDFAPPMVDLNSDSPFCGPLREAFQSAQTVILDDFAGFDNVPPGPWPETPHTALVLPITAPTQERPVGFLIAGVSARLALDDDYRGFHHLVSGHIGTAISNARAFEAERQRAEMLAEVDRAKTTFFTNISHEFRTPLTLMLGPLEDLLNNPAYDLDKTERDLVEVTHRNGLRLLKLVNTLLDFSRIQAGRTQAVYEPVDLAAYTAELASTFRSAIERAGIRYTVTCAALPEPVYIDRDMWEKIVLNLLSNAFKFTLEGEIEVQVVEADGGAQLVIRDTGIGIPAAELPRLFERFHRVPGSRGRTYEGTGIGLALVLELVKLHGGDIQVQSAEGEGSAFTVTLPFGSAHLPPERIQGECTLASTALGTRPFLEESMRWIAETDEMPALLPPVAAAEAAPPEGTRRYILLADDNADMRNYVERLLSPMYEVRAVEDGLAALEAAQERRPDLVLTDVMMPRMDGVQLLIRLRGDPQMANVPVILLSARAGEDARVQGMDAGADDYLVKPFAARELLARVRAHLDLARVRQAAVDREQAARASVTEILESIADAFYALDEQWRFTYINAKALEWSRKTRAELLGQNMWEALPHLAHGESRRYMEQAAATGQPMQFDAFSARVGRWYGVNVYPNNNGLSVYFRDITQQKRSEQQAAALQKITAAFSEALTPQQVAQVLVDQGLATLNATASVIALLSDDGKQLVTISGHHINPELFRQYSAVPVDAPILIAHAVREGKPIWIDSFETYQERYPEIARLWSPDDLQAVVALPLTVDGRMIGVLSLSFRDARMFEEEERNFIQILAQHCAQALERARLAVQAQEAAALEERQRLARDLHDAVSQSLFTASMLAEMLPILWERNPAKARESTEQLARVSRSALAEMRTLLLELRPTTLVNSKLGDLVKQLTQAIQGRRQITFSLDIQEEVSLPPDVHIAFYRVVQEALNNIAKHSRASNVHILLHTTPFGADLQVRDNGIGFDPAATSAGMGVHGMRERANEIEAALRVHSAPGAGTSVRLVWLAKTREG